MKINKISGLLLFGTMLVIQWSVPLAMIWKSESLLSNGIEVKFRLNPVDPYDPFRGNYLALGIDPQQITVSSSSDWKEGNSAFITFERDSLDFVKIKTILPYEPESEVEFLKVKIEGISHSDSTTLYLKYPFDRYFVNENKAQIIEDKLQKSLTDSLKNVYVSVKIKNGESLLNGLIIENEFLENNY